MHILKVAISLRGKGSNKQENMKDKTEKLKQLMLMQTLSATVASMCNAESKILAELEKLRKENMDGPARPKCC